ncbi:Nephrocystin-4 [Collichthys lucidus]|uniref:Nephrocystin-4 n=1 Tax=Collichthys lucidus TaxID=240159 RepID=A0A4U5UQA7_COLLU|nr:Nephrocystin-4 [Collichthys lucidus]
MFVLSPGDALLRPQMLKMLPFTLNRLTISLQPSLEKFESQLLQLINDDCHNTKQPGPEGTQRTVAIQERRLHVGVHNGWCFLDKPQVVVLEPLASGAKGTLTKDSLTTSSLPQMLGLRSSLELRLTNHRALAIVFQLEFVFSAPIGRETMAQSESYPVSACQQCYPSPDGYIALAVREALSTTSTSRAAFLQCLRWGVWCPFQEPADWKGKEVQLVLQGGAKQNPHGVMVYSTEMSAKTQSPAPLSASGTAQVSEAKDTITFRLSSSLERKASSPKASLRTKQEDISRHRRSPSSPSQGQKHASLASPPDSPQGPGACSRVSNIAHLEMDLQREGGVSPSALDEGDPLQELPFTPVHAPVITLGMNVPSSCSVSSRSSLAHLYSAGFPDIVDSSGQVAEVLDSTEPVPFDPQREETDLLHGNLLVFQFLAFTRIPTVGVGPNWPDNIYFTFQFYRFPPVTSQQLKLLTSDKVQHKASDPLPCVLASINKDGTVNSGSPGLQVQFRVDDGFLKPGEKRWFLRYLALHTMHIDIWDSDSLLLIGSTAIELKYMLRQGKSAVQALHEVEVLTTDYVGDDTLLASADLVPQSGFSPMTVHTIVRGRLHLRTGSIARNTAQACRLEIDGEHVPSFRRGIGADTMVPGVHNLNEPDGGQRKLNCMAAVHQREGKEDAKAAKVTDRTKEARSAKERHQVKHSEERSKAEGIANMLSQAITTQHLLYASLGSAEYMEFVLKNPFNVPQTVTIHSDDPELSVITSTEEWSYFKALTKTLTPLEENMFHLEEGIPGPRVYLRPKESIHIPLKYQSFRCDHTMALQGPSFLPTGKGSQMAKKNLSNIVAAKTIKVTFKAEDGKPMAICQVNVEPTPHVVDQTFRLYHPQLCFLKKAIRLPPWHDPTGYTVGDSDTTTHISVRCSDPNIICQTRMLVPGEPQDVYLKVPGSPSPHIKMFFVMVFTDKWMAAPSQIWQIYVHFLERVDVSCVTGQRNCQSLVLRGKQAIRKVKCFSSHPQEIEVDPEGVFVLPPAAVQELQLKVQPWRAGSRFLYVNAVDVEHRRLVTAWLLCLNVHRPVLSKAFEVSVPVGGGRGSSRKITYTNPYTSSRTFLLRSDHPDLLQFKEDKFQIGGGESYTIGLRFAPSQSPGSVEILVYVNNLEEKTEETFCVKVSYS